MLETAAAKQLLVFSSSPRALKERFRKDDTYSRVDLAQLRTYKFQKETKDFGRQMVCFAAHLQVNLKSLFHRL